MNHVIIIRLGTGVDGEAWHIERAKLLPRLIESLNAQYNQEFQVWWLDNCLARRHYDIPIPKQEWVTIQDSVGNLGAYIQPNTITTRVDTDDELAPNFTNVVRANITHESVLNLPIGTAVCGDERKLISWPSSSFLSVLSRKYHCYSKPHHEWHGVLNINEYKTDTPMWTKHIHDNCTRPEAQRQWFLDKRNLEEVTE